MNTYICIYIYNYHIVVIQVDQVLAGWNPISAMETSARTGPSSSAGRLSADPIQHASHHPIEFGKVGWLATSD